MKMKSINPTTEETINKFEIYSKDMVDGAVSKAKQSLGGWKNLDISERKKIIKKFGELLDKNKKEVADLISNEMGKPNVEAVGEVECSIGETVVWFLENTKKIIQDENINLCVDGVDARVSFEPIGVIGVITPWNFPIDSSLWKIIPAILVGNTVVYKPSELSTLCGLKIAELLSEAGLPDGVLNVVTGDETTGKFLVSSDINMVSFTGSSKTGRDIAVNAGKDLKKAVLELGGSDPFIVLDDAILDQAVNGALFGRFLNCGQVCTSAKRILVDSKVYNAFIEKFVEKVKKLKIGESTNKDTEIGPIVSEEQLISLESQVKDAISKGAKLLCGGERLNRKGYFYQPTVLTGIKKDMQVFNEEVFGPVASIMSFDSQEEAVEVANDTKYGLGASIWTQNKERANKMADNIQSGMVWINDFGTPYYDCPQGGIKESGIGRELSKYGVLEFCNMKTIVNTDDKTINKSWWFPYN